MVNLNDGLLDDLGKPDPCMNTGGRVIFCCKENQSNCIPPKFGIACGKSSESLLFSSEKYLEITVKK